MSCSYASNTAWSKSSNVSQKTLPSLRNTNFTVIKLSTTNSSTNRTVAGSIPASVSGFFIDIKSFRSHNDPGVDSVCYRNEYQKHFLGVKAAGA